MKTHSPIYIDRATIAVLHARARRARSEAAHNAVVRLIRKLTPRLHLRRLGAHWG